MTRGAQGLNGINCNEYRDTWRTVVERCSDEKTMDEMAEWKETAPSNAKD